MVKYRRHKTGSSGEDEVVKNISCPNCGKKLIKLPANYPLFDVQCSACSFKAQVKTSNNKSLKAVFGAGWDIMNHYIKAGMLIPPLILNMRRTKEILFFPFIPKRHLRHYQLSKKARRANYRMFNYQALDEIPYFELK